MLYTKQSTCVSSTTCTCLRSGASTIEASQCLFPGLAAAATTAATGGGELQLIGCTSVSRKHPLLVAWPSFEIAGPGSSWAEVPFPLLGPALSSPKKPALSPLLSLPLDPSFLGLGPEFVQECPSSVVYVGCCSPTLMTLQLSSPLYQELLSDSPGPLPPCWTPALHSGVKSGAMSLRASHLCWSLGQSKLRSGQLLASVKLCNVPLE